MRPLSKAERLEEFFRRLAVLPPARDFDEAWKQIAETIDQVEDELSGVPNNPLAWRVDGRIYPPQLDREKPAVGKNGVRRFLTVRHDVYIGENGAIEIRTRHDGAKKGERILSKVGANGKEVNDL